MGDTHEAPCCQTLWQGKLQGHGAILVGYQLGIEESGLIEVLTYLNLFLLGLLCWSLSSGLGLFCNDFLGLQHFTTIFHVHHFVYRHLGHWHRLVDHTSRSAHHGSTREPTETTIPIGWEDIAIEVAERQTVDGFGFPRHMTATTHTPYGNIMPRAIGKGYRNGRHQTPRMGIDLVEALVVERSHQLGIDRLTVSILDGERPLLLLSRRQSVTEGGPRQRQTFVGQGSTDGSRMGIANTVLYPRKGEQKTVVIFLLIFQFEVIQLVALIHSPLFDEFLTGKDTVDDVYVRIRRSHLYRDGLSVIGELSGREPEPVFGFRGRHLIIF